MRGTDVAKLAGQAGEIRKDGQRFVVLIAPGSARILRAVPPARRPDGGVSGAERPHDRGTERTQAPLRASTWAEAAEGLPPGLHYLH